MPQWNPSSNGPAGNPANYAHDLGRLERQVRDLEARLRAGGTGSAPAGAPSVIVAPSAGTVSDAAGLVKVNRDDARPGTLAEKVSAIAPLKVSATGAQLVIEAAGGLASGAELDAAIAAHLAAADPHPQYAADTALDALAATVGAHAGDTTNPHAVTLEQARLAGGAMAGDFSATGGFTGSHAILNGTPGAGTSLLRLEGTTANKALLNVTGTARLGNTGQAGLSAQMQIVPTAALGTVYGALTIPTLNPDGGVSGNVTHVMASYARVDTAAGYAGTIDNAYGYYAANPSKAGGTIANLYGLYLPALTAGTSNYGIYQAGTQPNVFSGPVRVANTASPLRVRSLAGAAGGALTGGSQSLYLSVGCYFNGTGFVRDNPTGANALLLDLRAGGGVYLYSGSTAAADGDAMTFGQQSNLQLMDLNGVWKRGVNTGDDTVFGGKAALGTTAPHTVATQYLFAQPAGSGATQYGQLVRTRYAAEDAGSKQGTYFLHETNHPTGNIASLTGIYAQTQHTGAGTTGTIVGIGAQTGNTGGAVTSIVPLRVYNPSGTGAVASVYGLYVEALTRGSSANYAVYTAGTTPSVFGGNVGVGGIVPTSALTLPVGTAAAQGVTFGDTSLYRTAAGVLQASARLDLAPASIPSPGYQEYARIGNWGGIGARVVSANQRQGVAIKSLQALTFWGDTALDGAGATPAFIWRTGPVVDADEAGDTGVVMQMRGDGKLGLGIPAASGIASRLTLAAGTAAADGIQFGTDAWLYRLAPGVLSVTGALRADGYQSADGTAGATATTGGATFKNGLFTGGTISGGGGAGGATLTAAIEGLVLEWVSATQVKVTAGQAYVESAGGMVALAADSVQTPARAADTWYYVYLTSAGAVEIGTTAPAAPYRGAARSKTGDNTRRYLGGYRTDASGNILNFLRVGNLVSYRQVYWSAPFRVLSAGSATTATAVSCAACVPPTSRIARIQLQNLAGSGFMADTSDSTGTGTAANAARYCPGGVGVDQQNPVLISDLPLNGAQQFRYWYQYAPSSGGAYADVIGYYEER